MAELSNTTDFPLDDALTGNEKFPAYDDSKAPGSRRVAVLASQFLTYLLAHADTTEKIQDVLNATLVAGANVTLTYDDVANTLTIAAAGGTSYTDEQVRDVVAAFLTQGTNITLTHNDAGDTLTIDAATGSSADGSDGIQGSSGVLRFIYANGASGTTTANGGAWTNNGSVGAANPTTTNRLARAVRHQRQTGTGAAQSAGLQSMQYLTLGAGFTFEHLGGIDTLVAGHRYFVGTRGNTTLTLSSDPSGFTSAIGFGRDAADTNLQLMHNDAAGTCTKVDTGIAMAAGDVIFVRITAVAGGGVTCRLERFGSANLTSTPDDTFEQTITAGDNLPADTQMMCAGHCLGNAGTAANGIIAMIRDSVLTPM